MRPLRRRPVAVPGADLPSHAARICIVAAAERSIAATIGTYPGVETGGVLVGFDDASLGALVVVGVSGPGPKAQHAAHRFNRDAEHCQRWLDACVAASGRTLDFVGEWHSHPEPDPHPSTVDVGSHVGLAANPACHRTVIAMLIAGSRSTRRTGVTQYTHTNAWSVRPDGVQRRALEVLPDSAYRDLLGAVSVAGRGTVDRSSDRHALPPFP